MNPACELQSAICFFTTENQTVVNIHCKLSSDYGESGMNIQMIRLWPSLFMKGHENVHDEQYSGRPNTVIQNYATVSIWNIVNEGWH